MPFDLRLECPYRLLDLHDLGSDEWGRLGHGMREKRIGRLLPVGVVPEHSVAFANRGKRTMAAKAECGNEGAAASWRQP